MQTYIALLRGINVSGKNSIKMDALKRSMEDLGFTDVRSYVQSGNLAFEAKGQTATGLAQVITNSIKANFGHTVPVLVFEATDFKAIVTGNPFIPDKDKDPVYQHISFLSEPPAIDAEQEFNEKAGKDEAFSISPQAVYLYCPGGYGNTRLSNAFIESKLKVQASTRNLKTCLALLSLIDH